MWQVFTLYAVERSLNEAWERLGVGLRFRLACADARIFSTFSPVE